MSAIRSNYSVPSPLKARPPFMPVTIDIAGSSVRSADADMMYAWSIGVTEVGQKYEEQQQKQREEQSCPPEVYIG